MTEDQYYEPPKSVTPRKRTYPRLPVVAVHRDAVLDEYGQLTSHAELVKTLRDRERTLFVSMHAADFVAGLDTHFASDPKWRWNVYEHERPLAPVPGMPKVVRAPTRVTVVVKTFGFSGGGRGNHNRYHKIIDPISMYGRKLEELYPSDEPTIVALLKFGVAIRNFCDDNNMEVRATSGGIAAQFLTDPRFYPDARRKVPSATNANVRPYQPGNYYHIFVKPDPAVSYNAYYIDQRRAHHYHAQNTPMPHADALYAIGAFAKKDTVVFDSVSPGFIGLYCLDAKVTRPQPQFIRSWLRHGAAATNIERKYIWSNELPLFHALGYRVTGVRAMWGSYQEDHGLARYAAWAETVLDQYEDPPVWLKTLLLATYGVLSTNTHNSGTIFRTAKRGTPITIPTGQHTLTGVFVDHIKLEPRHVNVLQRGLIEAATRQESISYTHYLRSKKYNVLQIHADGLFVEVDEDREPPVILPPWRMKQIHTRYQVVQVNGFTSDQETRIPGRAKDALPFRTASPGHAPRMIRKYMAVTGEPVDVHMITGEKTKPLTKRGSRV